MITRIFSMLILILFLVACRGTCDCVDEPLQPVFINFSRSNIDTLVIRKFKPNDNFQTLIDTFVVKDGYTGNYMVSNDSTRVIINTSPGSIITGFDWEIFIPAINRTVAISNIISTKETGSCASRPGGAVCMNNISTLKIDSQQVNLNTVPAGTIEKFSIFIHN